MIRFFFILLFITELNVMAQEKGHYNNSPFKQIDQKLPTPNIFRTASGAPGSAYYQQQADYEMDIRLDEETNRIYGDETITYHNNSPDTLEYLWVQLDQNIRSKESESKLVRGKYINKNPMTVEQFSKMYREPNFNGGFNLELLQDENGNDLTYMINYTMMRVNLEKPLKSGEKFSFRIKWWYLVNNYLKEGGRSGYEQFPDGNKLYVIAQFFPRMAVYSDNKGWQNSQFWGRSEYALPFGNYKVNISVPADHVLNATGKITNAKEVLSAKHYKRYQKAFKTYDKPLIIISQEEAEQNEKQRSKKLKTWRFEAENVRDFAFSSSRKFIWDAMAVKLKNKDVLAMSLYPKEGNPLWEEYSTKVVAHTLKEYSAMTFDYPYHKAISVHAKSQGMEYPMICWNYGRPRANGDIPDRVKFGMISVIIHEIGHNFFPMIVNSDEREWTWMDEGLNTFLQYTAEQNFKNTFPDEVFPNQESNYPSRRGSPKDIVEYMSMHQNVLMPIMTQGDHVYNFGANAYAKPAAGLVILRNTIMGKERFDYAFKTYANRWKFKHPTPADFFRTMEDASADDLDWFWRGWFYTTWYVDIGIKNVQEYYLSGEKVNEDLSLNFSTEKNEIDQNIYNKFKDFSDYDKELDNETKSELKNPLYFYEVTFEKPGKMMMPLLVSFEFTDGTTKEIRYPAYVWRLKEKKTTKFYAFEKEVRHIIIDKEEETADINRENNYWTIKY